MNLHFYAIYIKRLGHKYLQLFCGRIFVIFYTHVYIIKQIHDKPELFMHILRLSLGVYYMIPDINALNLYFAPWKLMFTMPIIIISQNI